MMANDDKAKEIGVSAPTVSRARSNRNLNRSTVTNVTVGKREKSSRLSVEVLDLKVSWRRDRRLPR
jgi:hypothetical protein